MNFRTITNILAVLLLLFSTVLAFAQEETAAEGDQETASVTIAILNSGKPYHVAFVRFYDAKGDIVLYSTQEFKIDISKSQRFSTGSVRKSVPIPKDAFLMRVEVTNCTNMHENEFLISDLSGSNNAVTFIFQGAFEDVIKVEFDGIQQDKPGTFLIKGANTQNIFYADYSNVQKKLTDEARIKDVTVEVSETSLFKYKITGITKDKNTKIVKVSVQLIEEKGAEERK